MSLPPATASAPVAHTNPLLKAGKNDAPDKKFSFFDLLDVVNPLQHIPIVNNIYRSVTGDEISNAARIAGGALYGGIVGAAIGGINAIAVNETGGDIGDIALTKTGLKSAEPEKTAQPTAKPAAPTFDTIPVIEVRPLAKKAPTEIENKVAEPQADFEVAAALPSPKDLNDITPGDAPKIKAETPQEAVPVKATPKTPDPNEVDVQKSMLQAMAKYEAMQRLAAPTGAEKTITADNGKRPSAAFNKMRHY